MSQLNDLRSEGVRLPALGRLYARGLLERAMLKKNFDDLKSTDPTLVEHARTWLDQYAHARRCELQSMGEEAKTSDEATSNKATDQKNSTPDLKHTSPVDPGSGK